MKSAPDRTEVACYGTAGSDAFLPLDPSGAGRPWVMERLRQTGGIVSWAQVRFPGIAWRGAELARIPVPEETATGYYRLRPEADPLFCQPFPVNGLNAPAPPVAVVRPVFTEWSYHRRGFYPGQSRPRLSPRERVGHRLRTWLRRGARFPAHPWISLRQPYLRNWRWRRDFWHPVHGNLEGLWNDEILSAWPLYLLLDELDQPYKIYSDVDLHNHHPDIFRHPVLILYGTEGITKNYYEALQEYVSNPANRLILWGCQGIGYRQYEYDPESCRLEYVATRGRVGMWGEPLEERDPAWDEGALLGFRFPTPGDGNWRYAAPYRTLRVMDRNHPLVRAACGEGERFVYEIEDGTGETRPGLLWAGGEFLEPARDDAAIVLGVEEGGLPRIGVGECRNVLAFAPTYWPAFWLWQYPRHGEIASFLRAAVRPAKGV